MELKSGKKLEAGLVVVGVGAIPNTDMFKGQLELLEDKPGGVKVLLRSFTLVVHLLQLCAAFLGLSVLLCMWSFIAKLWVYSRTFTNAGVFMIQHIDMHYSQWQTAGMRLSSTAPHVIASSCLSWTHTTVWSV